MQCELIRRPESPVFSMPNLDFHQRGHAFLLLYWHKTIMRCKSHSCCKHIHSLSSWIHVHVYKKPPKVPNWVSVSNSLSLLPLHTLHITFMTLPIRCRATLTILKTLIVQYGVCIFYHGIIKSRIHNMIKKTTTYYYWILRWTWSKSKSSKNFHNNAAFYSWTSRHAFVLSMQRAHRSQILCNNKM